MSRKSKGDSVGVKPRDQAPPIRLMSYNGSRSKVLDEIRLSDYLGRYVILLFFPNNTPTCHSEFESFSESVGWFADRSCTVLGLVVGSARDVLRLKQFKVDFSILCDEDGAVCRRYGMLDSKQGAAHRGLVILDKNHRVRHVALMHRSCSRSVRECIGIVDALVWQDRIEHGNHVAFPGDVLPNEDRNRDDASATLRDTTTVESPPRPTNFTTTSGTTLETTTESKMGTTTETTPTETTTAAPTAKEMAVKFSPSTYLNSDQSRFRRPTPHPATAVATTTIVEIPKKSSTSSTEISSATTISNTTSTEETPSTTYSTTTTSDETSMRRTTTTSETTSGKEHNCARCT